MNCLIFLHHQFVAKKVEKLWTNFWLSLVKTTFMFVIPVYPLIKRGEGPLDHFRKQFAFYEKYLRVILCKWRTIFYRLLSSSLSPFATVRSRLVEPGILLYLRCRTLADPIQNVKSQLSMKSPIFQKKSNQ